jgi:hypothetical protein
MQRMFRCLRMWRSEQGSNVAQAAAVALLAAVLISTGSYERWSKAYEVNMEQARKAHEAAESYRRQIGWGQSEVTVRVDDQGTTPPGHRRSGCPARGRV